MNNLTDLFQSKFNKGRILPSAPPMRGKYDDPAHAGLMRGLLSAVAESGLSVAEVELVLEDLPHLVRSFARVDGSFSTLPAVEELPQ
jgi:hypothetical protein